MFSLTAQDASAVVAAKHSHGFKLAASECPVRCPSLQNCQLLCSFLRAIYLCLGGTCANSTRIFRLTLNSHTLTKRRNHQPRLPLVASISDHSATSLPRVQLAKSLSHLRSLYQVNPLPDLSAMVHSRLTPRLLVRQVLPLALAAISGICLSCRHHRSRPRIVRTLDCSTTRSF